MFDRDFDPLALLDQVGRNQNVLNDNQEKLSIAIAQLTSRINEQQHTIDVLVNGLDAANKANEIILQGLLDDIHRQFKDKS